MRSSKVSPNLVHLNACLDACSKASAWKEALAVFAHREVEVDTTSWNSCIAACDWQIGFHLLRQMQDYGSSADLITYNSLMRACAKALLRWMGVVPCTLNTWKKCVDVLSELKADIISFNTCMNACEKGDVWETALHLFTEQQRQQQLGAVTATTSTFNSCIAACGKGKQWPLAMNLLDLMAKSLIRRSILSYMAAMSSCEGERWQESLELFWTMDGSGIAPDVAAFNSCMNAVHWQVAQDLLKCMLARKLQPTPLTYVALINSCKFFEWPRALHFWHQTQEKFGPNLLAASACINACEKSGASGSGAWQSALEVLPDSFSYNCVAARCGWQQTLELWRNAEEQSLVKDAMTYNSCIYALSQGLQGSSCLQQLAEMQQEFHATLEAAIAALRGPQQDWEVAIHILEEIGGPAIFNAALAVCAAESWQIALNLLSGGAECQDTYAWSAILSACERARAWASAVQLLNDMSTQQVKPPDFCRSSVMSAAVKSHEWVDALSLFFQLESSQADASCCGALLKACEGGGRWREVLNLWPLLQELQWPQEHRMADSHFQVSCNGPPEVTSVLKSALEQQWLLGYPLLPPGEDQLTHGVYKYVAGMQAMCARTLLQLVFDPFCGSGTVLIEAQVAGKSAIGCDLSPLAAFVAAQHADVEEINLTSFQEAIETVLEDHNDEWNLEIFKASLRTVSDKAIRRALRFAWLIATQWDDRPQLHHVTAAGHLLARRLRSLRRSKDGSAWVQQSDNRELTLQPVDAIITSPPYPGVYDYLSTADVAITLGLRAPTAAAEIGRRHDWHLSSPEEFAVQWQLEQEQWLQSAFNNLVEEGTATLMIGDGDKVEAGDGAFDCLASTVEAARKVGFELVATATITSTRAPGERLRGMRRSFALCDGDVLPLNPLKRQALPFVGPSLANGMQLCQEVEAELRELSQECRKKYPLIKEYTDRAILKIRHHREDANGGSGAPSHFPLEEILRAILMAWDTQLSTVVRVVLQGDE
eukprot:symbB.v1.2.013390.t1/scaffold945.1/size149787/2